MASIPTSQLPEIDAAAANAVSSSTDTHPISPVAQEEKDRLAKLLANRSDVKDLQVSRQVHPTFCVSRIGKEWRLGGDWAF